MAAGSTCRWAAHLRCWHQDKHACIRAILPHLTSRVLDDAPILEDHDVVCSIPGPAGGELVGVCESLVVVT